MARLKISLFAFRVDGFERRDVGTFNTLCSPGLIWLPNSLINIRFIFGMLIAYPLARSIR
jgi:hypothetical protein